MQQDDKLSDSLKELYDEYYDDSLDVWREIGADQKASNILTVAHGQHFERLLEWGAGNGALIERLAKAGIADEYYAAEISRSGLERIRQRAISNLSDAILFDGYSLPFPDKHFDLVILSHVLEHVEHPRTLLREVARIAQNLIIEVPRDYKAGVDSRAQSLFDYGHINLYTPTLLRFLLKSEKFEPRAEYQSFSSTQLLTFIAQKNNKTFPKLRVTAYDLLRKLAYFVSPTWRRETMINAVTIWCKCPN